MAGELAVTITAFRYDDTTSVSHLTPLGETVEQTVTLDNVVATLAVGTLEGYELHFKPEAIGNRLARYTLTDVLEGVSALVRELIFAWSPSLTPADPTNPVDVNGGIDGRITVGWADGVDTDAQSALDGLADRINAARAAFTAPS